jgi:hypothetical protein
MAGMAASGSILVNLNGFRRPRAASTKTTVSCSAQARASSTLSW